MDDAVQTNAADPAQLEYASRTVRQQTRRRRELWRWLLSHAEGRELLWDVILRELGMFQHIAGPLDVVYGQAALHNQACAWLGRDVTTHRDLFLQMQLEALKREEFQRRGNQASRARPRDGDEAVEREQSE